MTSLKSAIIENIELIVDLFANFIFSDSKYSTFEFYFYVWISNVP